MIDWSLLQLQLDAYIIMKLEFGTVDYKSC